MEIDHFIKEHHRQRNQPSGSAAVDVDPWPYYDHLLFLGSDDQHKPTSTNVAQESSDELMFEEIPPGDGENIDFTEESSSSTGQQALRPSNKRRRTQDNLDVRFAAFLALFEMERDQLDRLSPDSCEDVKYEILLWLRERVKGKKNRSKKIFITSLNF